MSFKLAKCVLAVAFSSLVWANQSQAAYNLSITNGSGAPGSIVTLKLNITGGMELDALNPAVSVTNGALLAAFRSTGIGSIWDPLIPPQTLASGTPDALPIAATKISNSLNQSSTADPEAVGSGVVMELDFKIPNAANLGDMYFVNINHNALTSAALDGGDLTTQLTFVDTGNGAGIGKITAVPEPSAFLLIGLVGGLGYGGRRFARSRKNKTAEK